MEPPLIDVPEVLATPRLMLRGVRAGDGAELHAAIVASAAELGRWMPWAKPTPEVETTIRFCRDFEGRFVQRRDFVYVLRVRDDGQPLGTVGLHGQDWSIPRFEIGYWLHTAHCGRGLVTEAAGAVVRLAFEHIRTRRVQIRCDARNVPSARVAEKLGFALEGTYRHDARDNAGELCDTRVYAAVQLPDVLRR